MGAAIALLVTALLGIAGYVVQNKASITANATQHELIQEASERQRAEDRAGKQLERVQTQNAELVYRSTDWIIDTINAHPEWGVHAQYSTPSEYLR